MTSQVRRKLPIGLQTFRKIREGGYYYVDKTGYVRKLVNEGKHYLLSRPRRFGKSLLLDTISELFKGSEPLFRGLDIHDAWDWSTRNPVIRLSFGAGHFRDPGGLLARFREMLDRVDRQWSVTTRDDSSPARLSALAKALRRKKGQRVVILVDEYDKPILDALDAPDIARANRDFLRAVYGFVEEADADIRFSFFTGVSNSKLSLFPGLNNLSDITLDPACSAVCGYTEEDLDAVFAPELVGLDRAAIREWYGSYRWLGEAVYNPWDILLLFHTRKVGAYWFETGAPTLLLSTLVKHRVSSVRLDGLVGDAGVLSVFDVDDITTEALLFQTGYLTITGESTRAGERFYRLGYPNREVRQSLNQNLVCHLVKDGTRQLANQIRLHELLESGDLDGLRGLFQAFFSSIPYEWYTNNDIASYEGYYASVFYSYFAALGLRITVEDGTSHGRLDMAVWFGDNVYLFEFKVVEMEPHGAAMAQLLERDYAAKYRGGAAEVYLVGVEFSRESRSIVGFEVGRR